MDAEQIRGLKSMSARYLKRFDGCFARKSISEGKECGANPSGDEVMITQYIQNQEKDEHDQKHGLVVIARNRP